MRQRQPWRWRRGSAGHTNTSGNGAIAAAAQLLRRKGRAATAGAGAGARGSRGAATAAAGGTAAAPTLFRRKGRAAAAGAASGVKRTTEQQFLPLEAQQQQQQAGSSPCAVMMPQPAAAGAAPPLALQGGRLVAWQPQQFCAFACLHSLFSCFASNHFDCNCERACAQPALSGHKWRAQPWCVLLAGEPLSCVLRVGCYGGLACCMLSPGCCREKAGAILASLCTGDRLPAGPAPASGPEEQAAEKPSGHRLLYAAL